MSGARRRRGPAGVVSAVLVTTFVVVPLLEIYVLIQVGQVIGAWWTIVLLVLDSILGSWLIRHQGTRAWQALRSALETGRMPAREFADGVLVVMGGTLMISPGFVTDLIGAFLILPVTRPLARRVLTRVVARRLTQRPRRQGRGAPGGPVVPGEVVDD